MTDLNAPAEFDPNAPRAVPENASGDGSAPLSARWPTRAWLLFSAGLFILVAVTATDIVLSPSGLRGESPLVDMFEGPLFVISFFLCILAPIFSHTSWRQRLWLVPLALLVYVATVIVLGFVGIVANGLPL